MKILIDGLRYKVKTFDLSSGVFTLFDGTKVNKSEIESFHSITKEEFAKIENYKKPTKRTKVNESNKEEK